MKRLISILLLLAVLVVPGALAAGSRLLKLEDGEYLRELISDGETLYALGDSALYACKPGDDEMTVWGNDIRLPDGDGAPVSFYELTLMAGDAGLRGLRIANDENGSPESMWLFDVAFSDAGVIVAENAQAIDLPDDLKDQEWLYIESACLREDALYLMGQGEGGCVLCVMDVNNPRAARVEPLNSWDCELLPTPDGVMMTDRDYMRGQQALYRVGEDGGLDEVCTLPLELSAVAADPVTGAVFGALEGKAVPVDIEGGTVGDAVAVLPTQPNRGAVLDGGRVYAAEVGANIALMDTEGQVDAGAALTIRGIYASEWIREAVVDYSVSHPELTPSLNFDDVTRDALLDAMMTQSPDVDIYMLGCTYYGAYQAMRERGFMLPLEGSEALSRLAERMYPALRDGCSRDGVLVALPVQAYGFTMGVDERMLNKLGMSMDDVPGDWLGFLDFLEDQVKPNLGALGENDRFTYDGMTAGYFAYSLRSLALNDFLNANAAVGAIPDYESPELVAILERIDGMDFTEYGLKETEEENYGYGWSSEEAYLIQPEVSVELGGNPTTGKPLILDFGDKLKGVLALNLQLAFVNPYSAHAEEAVEFIEQLAERMPQQLEYMLCPDLSEPVRWPEADRELEEIDKRLEQLRRDVEVAEPSVRQELEEELADAEAMRENYVDDTSWMIKEERLAQYRAMDDRLAMAVSSWFDQDSSGEAWDLLEQYRDGRMQAREFLAAVNRKARMMAMEG